MKAGKRERSGRPDLLDAWLREGGQACGQRSKAEPGQIPEAWFYCAGFFLNEMP